MTNASDFDPLTEASQQIELIAPADVQLDTYALRLRQADLARLLGCSRQVLNQWVQRGHVRLDPDGRVDARRAVEQVLRANLRGAPIQAKALGPVMEALRRVVERQAKLETDLAAALRSSDEAMEGWELLERAISHLGEVLLARNEDLRSREPHLLARHIARWAHAALYAEGEVPDLARELGLGCVDDDGAEEGSGDA